MNFEDKEVLLNNIDVVEESVPADTHAASADLQTHTRAPGTVFAGKYELLDFIGAGGMSQVYRAKDLLVNRTVAIKILNPGRVLNSASIMRFQQEAHAAGQLSHTNIASVFAFDITNDNEPYLVMDYVDGKSLADVIEGEGPLSVTRVANIIKQMLEALVHAHDRGVVHRDLKPGNIIVYKDAGGRELLKIVDFGIAKVVSPENEIKLTQTGEIFGSPQYMSPEQCSGAAVDGRADLYSLGCVAYEMLTKSPPLEAENALQIISRRLTEDAPTIKEAHPQLAIPAEISDWVAQLLARDPSRRYQTAEHAKSDLEAITEGRAPANLKRLKKSNRVRLPILFVCIAGAIIGGNLLMPLLHKSPQPTPAQIVQKEQQKLESYKGKTLNEWTVAIENSPNDPQLYVDRSRLHELRDERTNAIDDLNEALKLKPDLLEAFERRAKLYVLLARYDKAKGDADRLVALAPDMAGAYSARAWIYSSTEKHYEALEDLKKVLEITKGDTNASNMMAYEFIKLGVFEMAQKTLETALVNDEGAPLYGDLGFVKTLQHKYTDAYQDLKKATESNDARGVDWMLLAYYHVAVGNIPEAEKAIRIAKSVETFPARALRLSGEVYRTAGMHEKAIQEFSASTSLEEYPPGYRERAVAYMSLKQLRSAYADLRKSLDLNPESPVTLSYMAVVEQQMGKQKEGMEHLKESLKTAVVSPLVYVNKSTFELGNGDTTSALESVNRAIKINPWQKEAYLIRSRIYERLNNASAAKADADKANSLVWELDK